MRDVKLGSLRRPAPVDRPRDRVVPSPEAKVPLGPVTRPSPATRVEVTARTSDGRIDGGAFCQATLDQIRSLKRADPNARCVVVFDLDNTLFETRARTLDVLRAFDLANDTSWFEGFTIADVGWDGRESCPADMPRAVVDAVDAWWQTHFWSGDYFRNDLVIAPLFDLAWEAKRAGAEVRYLTGRVDALRAPTIDQLRHAGLPDADAAHLFTKPTVATKTGPFKHAALEAWMRDAFVGWFATDSRTEVEAICAGDPEGAIPVVHVEHPLQRPGVVSLDTPTFIDVAQDVRTPDHARRRAERFAVRRPIV